VGISSSVRRRHVAVAHRDVEHDRRTQRVAAMTGMTRVISEASTASNTGVNTGAHTAGGARPDREFDPRWDLVPVVVGVVGLVASAVDAGGSDVVAIVRVLCGAAFLGAVTDAMLLGHWYLVQPGLSRRLLVEQVRAVGYAWPAEVASLLLPTGMVSVLNGSVDDGWGGILGWTWIACAVATIVLVAVTRAALRERQYSAVMAATGLLYLAILTGFGTDLVARAVLAP
jgi:hypothetical protein